MDLGVISVRYARALIKSATELKVEDVVYENMRTLAQSYMLVPKLRQTIDNPMLSKDQKRQVLETACGGNTTELTKRFIDLVLNQDRERALQFMAASYLTLYRHQKNIIRAGLTTAVPVSQDIEEKMRQMVQKQTHGTVEFSTEVDPEIIGGFILEYDTYRLDASVRTHLNDVLHQLEK